MNSVIVHQKGEKVVITSLSPEFTGDINEYAGSLISENETYLVKTDQEVPTEFPEAIEIEDGNLVINMDKAFESRINEWRQMRERKFIENDREYLIALQNDDEEYKAAIEQRAQELRDLPDQDFSHLVTLEDLYNFIPPVLQSF